MSSAVGTKAEYNGKLRELTPVVPPMGEPGTCQEEEEEEEEDGGRRPS